MNFVFFSVILREIFFCCWKIKDVNKQTFTLLDFLVKTELEILVVHKLEINILLQIIES